MNTKTIGLIGMSFLAVLVILLVTLPVSAAGKTGPQDGTGYQYGMNHQYQSQGGYRSGYVSGSGNGTCIHENCPHTGIRPSDGTGFSYGGGKRHESGGRSGFHGHGRAHHS